jgi:hypothetical protein
MAGYAATGRIVRAHPRFVGPGAALGPRPAGSGVARQLGASRQVDPRPLDEQILDWWSEAREQWAQATFFLFDTNSWR